MLKNSFNFPYKQINFWSYKAMPRVFNIYDWKNKNNTSELKCTCPDSMGSWKEHWKIHENIPLPRKCIKQGCNNPVEVGAHIFKKDKPDLIYIAPFCQSCSNSSKEEFGIDGSVTNANCVEQKNRD